MSLMLAEIAQQPEVIARTIEREGPRIAAYGARLQAHPPRMIVMVARGSSDNAALFGRYLLEMTTGIPVSMAAPSIHTLYRRRLDLRDTLVIGVSQSGEGVDINLVLENAKKSGASTLAITNEAKSTMAGLADETFVIQAGRERSVAATKTYTGQLLIFHLLARALSRSHANLAIERLPELAAESLTLQPMIEALVERYTYLDRCVVVGRGLQYANAYEFSIKLMETCYVVAERFSGADFQHGPIALVEPRFPVFLFAQPGPTLKGTRELLTRLKGMGAETLLISSEQALCKLATRAIHIPTKIEEPLSAIPYIIPGQLFAGLLAATRGLNPDQPRSLTKVTRTV
jgi:glucosamine--fructose-6-phosphate aminotransferase (isomerizing)